MRQSSNARLRAQKLVRQDDRQSETPMQLTRQRKLQGPPSCRRPRRLCSSCNSKPPKQNAAAHTVTNSLRTHEHHPNHQGR